MEKRSSKSSQWVHVGKFLIVAPLLFGASACTDAGEATKMGAAAGGAVGAGLGAIVGNQTGSTGGGFVLGALAGSSSGALIGNAFDEQSEELAARDEAMRRQEERLNSQEAELNELRRLSQDKVSFREDYRTRNNLKGTNYKTQAAAKKQVATETISVIGNKRIDSPNTGASNTTTEMMDTQTNNTYEFSNTPTASMKTPVSTDSAMSPQCTRAATELRKAKEAFDSSDKLFHFRRALRLCPDEPKYHNELGELYLSLDRTVDAEFEFREALSIDPNFQRAQANLDALN